MRNLGMPLIRRLADDENPSSYSNQFRARRFRLFEAMISRVPRPLRLLDVGGTNAFWEQRGWAGRDDVRITLLNISEQEQRHANISALAGDATNLERFADRSFDVAFSNSVIEHLFTLENQINMANEIQRVSARYWVQTPNFWFPIEPHFHVPGWQWLPTFARTAIIRRFSCGWRGRCPDPIKAREIVREVRLMTRTELARAFRGGKLVPERAFGLTKSWVVIGGDW